MCHLCIINLFNVIIFVSREVNITKIFVFTINLIFLNSEFIYSHILMQKNPSK